MSFVDGFLNLFKVQDDEFDDDYDYDEEFDDDEDDDKPSARPESMEDASEITDTLLSGKAVVLNLEGIHVEIAQRIIDYSAGSCYSIRGNLQKITNYIFLVTPPNVDISGDIPEIVAGGIDLTSFKNDTKF